MKKFIAVSIAAAALAARAAAAMESRMWIVDVDTFTKTGEITMVPAELYDTAAECESARSVLVDQLWAMVKHKISKDYAKSSLYGLIKCKSARNED